MHVFYTPDILKTNLLPEEESKHCIRVLRLKQGDEILLTDGTGMFYQALIIHPDPNHCGVKILKETPDNFSFDYSINISVCPTKNMDRIEWFVEKATEIGISEINFPLCRFSERKELKTNRLEKILISAMKQSGRATLPVLNEMISFEKLITQPFDGQKFIAHCYPEEKLILNAAYQKKSNVWILIGPEGDFSKEEIVLAKKNGFESISLGKSRLRTETAALVACHTIHVLNTSVE